MTPRLKHQALLCRANLFVFVMALFVFSAHCTSTIAQASGLGAELALLSEGEQKIHCDELKGNGETSESCPGDAPAGHGSRLQPHGGHQVSGGLELPELILAPFSVAVQPRAGPAPSVGFTLQPRFPSLPLYYRLRVLRL